MKIVLENRTRHRMNQGNMKSVFETRSRIKITGTPGSVPDVSVNFRILEDDDFRITESGDFRILE